MTGTNTIYADKTGNIAYWHGNFVPIRASGYDWSRPVPGNTSETEWKGSYALKDIPNYINPKNGWVQNANSTPLYGIGTFDSGMFRKPSFMFPDGHTPRAMNAIEQLKNSKLLTIDNVIKMANSPYLMSAKRFIPSLVDAYDKNTNDTIIQLLIEPINVLKQWNFTADTNSIATTLAVLWVEKLVPINLAKLKQPVTNEEAYAVTNGSELSLAGISGEQQLKMLIDVMNELKKDWGKWQIEWGAINRYQRSIKEPSDSAFSVAVTATPGFMGSLNAYVSKKGKETKRLYGISGNTFVAAISFGSKLTGKTIITGGSSSDPKSPHFTDQANGYINASYKPLLFYKADVLKNKQVDYKPGE
jgi:acyl-homoserine lactone acylase PvdQ